MNASGADSGATDDMRTAWADLLTPEAQDLQRRILRAYNHSDKLAGQYQGYHRWATLTGALFGTSAVGVAIYQLYQLAGGEAVQMAGIVEVTLAVLAGIAVIAGLVMAFMRRWLLERHRAERLRLLKYRLLLSDFLAAAQAHPGLGLAEATSAFDEIHALDDDGLEAWLDGNPRTLSFGDFPLSMSAPLENLSLHYLNTRLRIHETFFRRRARKQELIDELTKRLPVLFFFGSILVACFHFAWEASHHFSPDKVGDAPHVLLLVTAVLPVLGAGIRTWRGAYEFSRNALRYSGYHLAVHDVTESLRTELEKDEPNPYVLLNGMAKGEHLFEDEHREWLRLTKEVEWFA